MQRSASGTRDSRVQHSVRALAHSVSPSAWRDVVEMRRADPTVAIAIRVGLATLIALVGGGVLGYSEVAGFAALGSLCCAFLRHEPYPRMAGKLACIGACVVAYTFAGAVLGALGLSIWLQIAVLSVAAGLAYLFLSAFRMTGPGPVILIFAAAGAAGFAHTGSDVRIDRRGCDGSTGRLDRRAAPGALESTRAGARRRGACPRGDRCPRDRG